MKDIIQKEEDREKAISYGAALFASGIVGIRQTAPYSIALYQTGQDGNPEVNYAFRIQSRYQIRYPIFSKLRERTAGDRLYGVRRRKGIRYQHGT